MKLLEKFVERCMEPKPDRKMKKEIKELPILGKLMFLQYLDEREESKRKTELLRLIEDAEQKQLEEILRERKP